jgi:hypothetical protein
VAPDLMALHLALRALPESADVVVDSSLSMFWGLQASGGEDQERYVRVGRSRHYVGICKRRGRALSLLTFATLMLEEYIVCVLRRAETVIRAPRGITTALVEGGLATDKAIPVSNGISTDLLDAIVHGTAGKVENRRPVAYAGGIGYNQHSGGCWKPPRC